MKRAKGAKQLTKTSDESDSRSLTVVERNRISAEFEVQVSRNKALLDEIAFILRQRLSDFGIKVHEVEQRIKSLDSVLAKCERKGLLDHNALVDVVGARVVCLFRSDMSKVTKVIEENFDVMSVDDKLSSDGPLGYQSMHYVCKLPDRYKGPRYENTQGVQFEIQVRTLCMHAWAAVSHHLDYKGDWDVPEELKQALSALGGLFYVADNQFDQFNSARSTSISKEEDRTRLTESQEINLDTMRLYLQRKFPDRGHSDVSGISDLVKEIKKAGYSSINEVDRDLDRGSSAFKEYEPMHPPTSGEYVDVGVVRCTLRIVSDSMREVGQKSTEGKMFSDSFTKSYEDFSHLVKSD